MTKVTKPIAGVKHIRAKRKMDKFEIREYKIDIAIKALNAYFNGVYN